MLLPTPSSTLWTPHFSAKVQSPPYDPVQPPLTLGQLSSPPLGLSPRRSGHGRQAPVLLCAQACLPNPEVWQCLGASPHLVILGCRPLRPAYVVPSERCVGKTYEHKCRCSGAWPCYYLGRGLPVSLCGQVSHRFFWGGKLGVHGARVSLGV